MLLYCITFYLRLWARPYSHVVVNRTVELGFPLEREHLNYKVEIEHGILVCLLYSNCHRIERAVPQLRQIQ
jgi:hypothetical protein